MMCHRVMSGIVISLIVVGLLAAPGDARAQNADEPWVSKIVSVQGRVFAKLLGETDWQPVHLNDTLVAGDQIRVEADSRAGILLRNDAVLRLDQNTSLVFSEIEEETTFIFKLLKGAANFFSRRSHSLKILTPFVNGVVEGTEFLVQVDADHTRIDLFEGRIRAQNEFGVLQLAKGQGAVATAGQAPQRRILIQPRESVQWALYYPPVLAFQRDGASPELETSMSRLNQGRPAGAIDSLSQVPEGDRDARYFTWRAGLMLHVGRVSNARADIQQALALTPNHGDALALKAVIAVVQNRKAEALAAARQAVRNDSRSAAAQLALSYALQAEYNLPEALQAAQAAVALAPNNGTARARLAELRLSTGQLDQGIQAAQKAAALQPNTAHAHTILGFAYLTQIKLDKAREAFDMAITLDSAAPLPRLGLGLAKIRRGELADGRREIEIAAGLDPVNALIRSYLGKAYFDEKRGPLDEKQLEIAKMLDPNDPTPWFYDAIRKQTLNRPGEALQDLQQSIALNDNRAVYRSRLLLDEDLAARSTGLGRIYNDLGFQESAMRQGWKSLNLDPANHSAHQLLADIYASRSRHEISRVSELLQSQLFQPLNINPLQPQLAESSQLVAEDTGPASLSFNEFNPMFTRDGDTLQASGVRGSNNAWGDQLTLSGLHRNMSYSLGQYHYETDGFRINNNLEQDITNAFVQAALSPRSNLQYEYRPKETTSGDLQLRFEADDFRENYTKKRKDDISRLGYHFKANERNHFIASLFVNDTDFTLDQQTDGGPGPFGPVVVTENTAEETDSYNVEGQYLFRGNHSSLIVGVGSFEAETDQAQATSVVSGPVTLLSTNTREVFKARHTNAYAYLNVALRSNLDVTLGLSGDAFDKQDIDAGQWNPKVGLSWYVSPALTLRAAAFRTLKRALISNQTIEPTQVAGFTQFFDDKLATDAKRYGLGLDYSPADNLAMGVEFTFGDLTLPTSTNTKGVLDQGIDENYHRAYLYWLPHPKTPVSMEYTFEHYERDLVILDTSTPHDMDTHMVPLTIGYFEGCGFFTKLRGTYVKQEIEQFASANQPADSDSDEFFIVDAEIGFRLPRRRGVVALSATNLFDREFKFHDSNFRTAEEQIPMILPERQIVLKATLRF